MKALFDAIKAGDADQVRELLDGAPELANDVDDAGVSAFTFAHYCRKDAIGRLLLERGAKIDVFGAAMAGETGRLGELLAADAELACSFSKDGWTPLHLAAYFGRVECVKALLDAGARVNERSTNQMRNMPLHAAAGGRQGEAARLLIERGAYVNARQQGGWAPLHAAAQNGDGEMARLLIAAGADVAAQADNRQTPLDLALGRGDQEMVEILEHYGAAGA